MTSQLSTIICVIFGVVSWYYFNKFMESEREYLRLHKNYDELHIENRKMKSRIKDLQSYKNDVSKTFKILDNELVLINDHLKRNSQQNIQESQTNFPMNSSMNSSIPIARIPLARVASFTSLPQNNNISLLTPELLTSLFNMNTEDITRQNYNRQLHDQQLHDQQQVQQQVQERVQQQVQERVQQQVQERVQQQVQERVQERVQEQVQEQVQVQERVQERVQEQVQERVQEQVHERVQQPVQERVQERVQQQVQDQPSNNFLHHRFLYDTTSNQYDQFLINNN
jgi:predicted nuclease with TOPRIM domain